MAERTRPVPVAEPGVGIPVFKPHIGSETTQAATEALEMGWLGMGSYVHEFEQGLTNYLELAPQRQLVAVNTGTSALHLALLVAGVGPGDEVITPALNNIGDLQAIAMCGAEPVFADIREENYGIDLASAERMLSSRTKAIIALHYMGIPCDRDDVFEFAREHGLRVIEDMAHAIGTRWQGRPIGADGDLVAFSFDAIKTLTCVDGGAVVVPTENDAAYVRRARFLGTTQSTARLYTNQRSFDWDVEELGFRYHLSNLHAAIGLSQLERLPTFIENRRRYARLYNAALGQIEGLIVPQSDFEDVSLFHYVIRVLNGRRSELANFLRERGIDTGIHWKPGHRLSRFSDCRGADTLPVADRVGSEITTLPLWSFMDDRVIETVVEGIANFFDPDVGP
jgi:dTDP-4-amino-4,6-dideoxygalactose transaminase